MPRPRPGRALLLGLVLTGSLAATEPTEPPELVFAGPLAAHAPEVAKETLADLVSLVGLESPGPPIRVLLEPETSGEARLAPAWVAGYTDGVSGVIVLLPARTPSYPDDALADVLCHEVAHVLIARAAGGREVPRWFNEGVAMMAGRSWGLRDRTELALELFAGDRVPLWMLDDLFTGDRTSVRRAYALSGALVQSLIERHGPGLPRALFSRVRRGIRFDEAFPEVTGRTLDEAGDDFWHEQTVFRRWIPILTSSALLWFAISVLAIVAIRKRRAENRLRRAQWADQERLEMPETVSEDGHDPGDDDEGRP